MSNKTSAVLSSVSELANRLSSLGNFSSLLEKGIYDLNNEVMDEAVLISKQLRLHFKSKFPRK